MATENKQLTADVIAGFSDKARDTLNVLKDNYGKITAEEFPEIFYEVMFAQEILNNISDIVMTEYSRLAKHGKLPWRKKKRSK